MQELSTRSIANLIYDSLVQNRRDVGISTLDNVFVEAVNDENVFVDAFYTHPDVGPRRFQIEIKEI